MITGDDILIEYVQRLVRALPKVAGLASGQTEKMEKFIQHYVWHSPDVTESSGSAQNQGLLSMRLNNRLAEMTDRRRRLIKYMFKKEDKLEQFDKEYPTMIRKKEEVINKFSSTQLEDLLNNSTKNVAQEVVSCLIPRKGEGVLVTLEGGAATNKEGKQPINRVIEQTEHQRASLHARADSNNRQS